MPFSTSQTALGYRSDAVRLPQSAMTEDTSGSGAFLAKYDSAGRALWAARISSAQFQTTITYSVATDSAGNVYATGSVQGSSVRNAGLELYNSDGTYAMTVVNLGLGGTDAFVIKYNSGGFVQWGTKIRGAGSESEIGYGVAVDSTGSVLVTGQGGSAAVLTAYNANGTAFGTTLANVGNTDAFLVKYNTTGTVQWVARVGSTVGDIGYASAVDSSGSVYITGTGGSGAVVTAYSANGAAFGTTLTSRGGGDTFLVKYNSSGTVQWVAQVASTVADTGYGVATDSSGNVYVTGGGGAGTVTAYSFNGVAFGTTLANAGAGDTFLVKYNTTGTVQWVARVASTAADVGRAIATDTGGNIIITGQGGSGAVTTAFSSNGVAFGTTLPSRGAGDTFLVKYDTNGTVQWVAQVGSTQSDVGYGVATDSNDNVYLVGVGGSAVLTAYSSNSTAFGTTLPASSYFLVKYNSSGTVQWITRMSGASQIWGVDTDANANIVIGGAGGGRDFFVYGKSLSTFATMSLTGTQDAFVAKYNTNGRPQWVARIASSGNDIAYSTATDSVGSVYVVGTGGSAAVVTAFNADGTAFGTTLPNSGGTDVFLVKYNSAGAVQWVARVAGTANDDGRGIAIDSADNVYICGGHAATTVSAFSSNGVAFGTTIPSRGAGDAFLVKYNSSGIVQWIAQIGSTAGEVAYSVAVAPNGNVYVTGSYGNATLTAYNFDGTAFGTTLSATGTQEAFLVKYNSSGNVQWVARLTSGGTDIGWGVAVDFNENVYVCGTFVGTTLTAWSSNGASFGTTLTNAGTSTADGFLVKYNASGIVQWITRLAGNNVDRVVGIATDRLGNVYVSGGLSTAGGALTAFNRDGTTTTGTANAGFGFLVKYNDDGFAQWVASTTGASIGNTSSTLNGVAVDRRGNVYIGGNVNDLGANGQGSGGIYVVSKYSPGGRELWFQQFGIPGDGVAPLTNGVAVDYDNNVIAVGRTTITTGTLLFYDRDLTVYSRKTPIDDAIYIAQYSPGGIPKWVVSLTTPGSFSMNGAGMGADSSGNLYVLVATATAPVVTIRDKQDQVFGTISATGFIVKYSSSGSVQWVANSRLSTTQTARPFAVDPSGNSYTACTYFTATTPSNADGSAFGTSLPAPTANGDFGIVKYNASGFVQWVARIVTLNAQEVDGGVATDSSGNVYVVGKLGAATATAYNADGSAFGTTQASTGAGDAFVAKYDTNGAVQWWARVASTVSEQSRAVAADASGNVFVVGETGAATVSVFNANGSLFTSIGNSGGSDVFLVKYNSTGTVQWAIRPASSTQSDAVSDVAIDSAGNIYVSGTAGGAGVNVLFSGVSGTQTIQTGTPAMGYLLKLSTAGALLWVATGPSATFLGRLRIDSTDAIFVQSTGVMYDAAQRPYGSVGSTQVTRYDTAGTVQSMIAVPSGRSATALASDALGNAYVEFWTSTLRSLLPVPA